MINRNMEKIMRHELFSKEGRNKGIAKLMETILNQVLELQAEDRVLKVV